MKKQKCTDCEKDSIKGMTFGNGKCQYHWNIIAFGKEWADKVKKDLDTEKKL